MVTLCQVFGVHRSSYRYWKNRPEKPDGRRAVLRSQVLELHEPPRESWRLNFLRKR
ncbi:putative transposase [Shigella boydii 3594-74]|nr:putative transposase [Shigella boydii 3594-74]